jgi:2-polyprenyl-3-methyl-5-hydroxy-6-metoxy-1,4-benzoquinol methylase
VTGVDIDSGAVGYATRRHCPEGVSFVCASGDATPLKDQSVDVVVSFETIEHLPSDVSLLQEFHRILRPDGLLICSTPNNWPLTEHHLRRYDLRSFDAVLRRWFTDLRYFNQNSGSAWPYNRGQAAGICETSPENQHLAECFIGVGRRI